MALPDISDKSPCYALCNVPDILWRPSGYNAASRLSAAGPHVNDMIGAANDIHTMTVAPLSMRV